LNGYAPLSPHTAPTSTLSPTASTSLPDLLPPTLRHLHLTKSPIASLGGGLSSLRHLTTLAGLDSTLTALPDLSKFRGTHLDLRLCHALFECVPDKAHESQLQQVYRRQPFDASAWLRLVFPWVVSLERRGATIEPPKPDQLVGQGQIEAVQQTLTQLVGKVRTDTAHDSRSLAKKFDGYAMLSPDANRVRAISVCRAALRKRVSLEELRIEAQRVVRLERLMGGHGGGGGDESGEGGEGGGGAAGGGGGGTAGGGASEGGGRARKSRDDMKSVDARDEKEVNTMARVMASKLDELDAQLLGQITAQAHSVAHELAVREAAFKDGRGVPRRSSAGTQRSNRRASYILDEVIVREVAKTSRPDLPVSTGGAGDAATTVAKGASRRTSNEGARRSFAASLADRQTV